MGIACNCAKQTVCVPDGDMPQRKQPILLGRARNKKQGPPSKSSIGQTTVPPAGGKDTCLAAGCVSGQDVNASQQMSNQDKHLQSAMTAAMVGMPQLPAVTKADADSLKWLNAAIETVWPRVDETVRKIIYNQVEPLVNDILPDVMDGHFHFNKFSLGAVPPQLGPLQLFPMRDKFCLEVRVDFESTVDVEASLGVTVGVHSIRFTGDLVLEFGPMIGELPIIAGMKIYFLDPPRLDHRFTGLARVAEIPVLKHAIRSAVDSAIAGAIVMPNAAVVPFQPHLADLCAMETLEPIGVLRVTALHASGLRGEDWNLLGKATSDPYLWAKIADREWRSSTISGTCDPVWNTSASKRGLWNTSKREHERFDSHDFVVYDERQRISIQLFDEDLLSNDDYLGCIRPLSVREAISSSESELELFRRASSFESKGSCQGKLCMRFEWLNLAPNETKRDGNCCLFAQVGELRLPQGLASAVQLRLRVGADTARTQFKSTPQGQLDAVVDGVDQKVQDIVRKAAQMNLDHAAIAELTSLDLILVKEILKSADCKTDDCQSKLAGLRHEDKSSAQEILSNGQVVSVLDYQRTKLYLPANAALLESGDIQVEVADRKRNVLANTCQPLRAVVNAADSDQTLELRGADGVIMKLCIDLKLLPLKK